MELELFNVAWAMSLKFGDMLGYLFPIAIFFFLNWKMYAHYQLNKVYVNKLCIPLPQ